MKNRILILLFCYFAVLNIRTLAQVKIGPVVGANLSTMKYSEIGYAIAPKTVVGYHIGVISDISLNKNVALQPGIIYTSKGTKIPETSNSNLSINPCFFEIPFNFKYNLNNESSFIFAGPYMAFGVGGKYSYSSGSERIKFGSGNDKDMKSLDFGINAGVGVKLNNFQVSAQYGLGLTNLAPVKNNSTIIKTRAVEVSCAYLFPNKH